MNIFLQLMKKISFILIGLVVLLAITMAFMNKKIFNIKNDAVQKIVQYYDPDLTVQADGLEIMFLRHEIKIKAPIVILKQDQDHSIKLENFSLNLNLLKLNGQIDAQIFNSEIMSLIYLKNNPEVMSVVTNFRDNNYLICDGNIKINLGLFRGNEIELDILSNNGWHDPKKTNLAKLALKKFHLSLNYSPKKIAVKQLDLEYINSFKGSFVGDFILSGNELISAEFQTNLEQFPIDYLAGFWPKNIFPQIQSWVTNHVSQGVVTKAAGTFKLTEKDFDANIPSKESINVAIECSNMNLNYLEQYSPLSKINGIVRIDGHGLYVSASDAMMLSNKLENVELSLSFDQFILSLKTNVNGAIAKFSQFIPEEVLLELQNYNIDFSSIKGNLNGKLSLDIPIFEEFKLANLKLDIQADIKNVTLDKKGLMKFKQGSFEIFNENDKIRIKLLGAKDLILEFYIHHDVNRKEENQININTEISTQDKIVFKDKIAFNNGVIRPKINLKGSEWEIDIDLKDAEVSFFPLGYTKPKLQAASIQCSGGVKDGVVTSESCVLSGKDFTGQILFTYSVVDGELTKLMLNNIKLGPNDFSLETSCEKNTYNYKLAAKYLDLTAFSSDNFSSNSSPANYGISFKVNKMLMPNKNYLHDVAGKINQIGKNPINIDFKAFANNEKIAVIKVKKNNLEGYMLHSKAAATFAQDFGIYNNIKKGEIWIEGYPEKTAEGVSYNGTFKLERFAFTNTSAFTKIILGVSSLFSTPSAILDSLKGGSLQADSFDADWIYKDGILHIKNAVIKGPLDPVLKSNSYQIKFAGNINFNSNIIDIKGIYIPSVYGINSLISNFPVLGKILSGGKDSAFIGSNFSIKGNLKNPKVSFSALSLLTLGFTRNLFN